VVGGLDHLIEDPLAQLGMIHLPATEGQGHLDLVALVEELLHLASLGVEVALGDLRPVLHLLDGDAAGLPPRFLRLLGRLVLVLAVIHDPADRRVGLGGHLHQVEVGFACDGQGFGQRPNADLLTVRTDQTHLAGAYAVVDPGLVVRRRSYRRSLLIDAQNLRTQGFQVLSAPENDNADVGKPTSANGPEPGATDRPGAPHEWPGGATVSCWPSSR
jgi:hypothetical protein